MDPVELLRRQRASRIVWHELDEPPRRAVAIRRPNETEVLEWRDGFDQARMRQIALTCVVDWREFTEADILGPSQAPADMQPFNKEVFAEWVQDEPVIQAEIAKHAVDEFRSFKEKKADAAKNSMTS